MNKATLIKEYKDFWLKYNSNRTKDNAEEIKLHENTMINEGFSEDELDYIVKKIIQEIK
jgi:uncharacterized membrane-anchored protein